MTTGKRVLGFGMALALVVGNMIGSGVYLLPATLAPLGLNALAGWVVTIIGAMALAWVFFLSALGLSKVSDALNSAAGLCADVARFRSRINWPVIAVVFVSVAFWWLVAAHFFGPHDPQHFKSESVVSVPVAQLRGMQ
jgi:hypothetical protein